MTDSVKLKAYLAGALLAVLVAALSACGSGDNDATASEERLTKAKFIKQASAICAREDDTKTRRLEEVADPAKGISLASRRELTDMVVEVILPLYDELISELASLNPPAKDEAEVKRVIDSYEATMKDTEANPAQMIKNDPFWKPNEVAARYGIENCSL